MNALKRNIILCIRNKLIIVFLATIITLLILSKSMADNRLNRLQIGTCRNQNNQVSIRVVSVEKVKSSLGNNVVFRHETDDWLKLLQNNKMYAARFRYKQLMNSPQTFGPKNVKVCTGDFYTNVVKIDLSES